MRNIFKLHVYKSNSGVTLIELLLYMGVFSILMIVLFQLLISVFDVQLESRSTSSINQDGRYILNRFNYDIGQADSVSNPSVPGSGSAILEFASGVNTYRYYLDEGNLFVSSSPSGSIDRLNSINTNISNVNFLRLSDLENKINTITITFDILSETIRRGGQGSKNFKSTSAFKQN